MYTMYFMGIDFEICILFVNHHLASTMSWCACVCGGGGGGGGIRGKRFYQNNGLIWLDDFSLVVLLLRVQNMNDLLAICTALMNLGIPNTNSYSMQRSSSHHFKGWNKTASAYKILGNIFTRCYSNLLRRVLSSSDELIKDTIFQHN